MAPTRPNIRLTFNEFQEFSNSFNQFQVKFCGFSFGSELLYILPCIANYQSLLVSDTASL